MMIQKTYRYDAFGIILKETGSDGELSNRLTYTGQMLDCATGQYYLRARFYHPEIGRFMQEDVYRGDGLNLYAYCANNPVMYYDPSGYIRICTNIKTNSQKDIQHGNKNRRQALNEAKDLAGVPRTQQPRRQWTVGDDVTRRGYSNYVYDPEPSHHGRFYEYDTPNGRRVIVEHTNDIVQGLHVHAGMPKQNPKDMYYDFKKHRYQKINAKGSDHHIRYR